MRDGRVVKGQKGAIASRQSNVQNNTQRQSEGP